MATAKVSLTLDEGLLAEAREQVGGRGLSAYVNEALRRRLQHDRLRRLLADLDAEHGPIPDDVMEEVRRAWPVPGERKAGRAPRRRQATA